MSTPGVVHGSEKGILSFKQKSCSHREWNTLPKQNKTAKAEIHSISGVSSFLIMPGSNKVKVLPIMEYSNNCPLNYY